MTDLHAPDHNASSVEDVRPDEVETIEAPNATFDELLQTTSKEDGHAVMSVRARAHGIVVGRIRIADGLPPTLAGDNDNAIGAASSRRPIHEPTDA